MTEPVLPDDEREQLVLAIKPMLRDAIRAERRPLWREPWFWFASGAVVLFMVAFWGLQHSFDHKLASKDTAIDQSNKAVSALASQVRGLGGVPVATPTAAAGKQGARGAAGPGPTTTQIASAVSLFCADHSGCTGTPSPADVASAVKAYCATGVCRGTAGKSGTPGVNGASGAAGAAGKAGQDGATGPGPTDAQITAAISAYCTAHDGCTGPAGPKGDTGSNGKDGRGIASIDCTGLGAIQLTIHYDDNTSQVVSCPPADTSTPSGAPS